MQNDLELYKREDLLDHMKNPYNQGVLADATVKAFEVNPMCGDELTLYLKLNDQGNKITNAKFTGHTCGVCTLSASLLTENIIDSTVEHAKNLTKNDILKLIDINLSTSRIKCATLPLEALLKALKNY